MQPGDVIPVEMPEEMLMRANGMPTYQGQDGRAQGQPGLQILEPVSRGR